MTRFERLGHLVDTLGGAARQRAFRTGWPARTSAEIAFFEGANVQYRYRVRSAQVSEAPTIVFTADPPVTLEAYDALLGVFTRRFRVVVVELPAMGFSAADTGYGFGFRETNDDLAAFLEAVAGPSAIWAFSCVAGLAAVDLAVRRPDLASDLVLLQTGDVAAFQRWKAARDPKGVLARPVVGQLALRRLAPKRMSAWYELSVGNREKVGWFCDCAAEAFRHGAQWSLASAYQTYMRPDLDLPSARQPILAIWGRADGSHPEGNEASAERLGQRVERVAFDDLGHFAELEDPERVFSAISQWLNRESS